MREEVSRERVAVFTQEDRLVIASTKWSDDLVDQCKFGSRLSRTYSAKISYMRPLVIVLITYARSLIEVEIKIS